MGSFIVQGYGVLVGAGIFLAMWIDGEFFTRSTIFPVLAIINYVYVGVNGLVNFGWGFLLNYSVIIKRISEVL